MTTHLKGKHHIEDLSYRHEHVKELEESGIEIIDLIRAGRGDPDLYSWAAWFKQVDHPCFAARVGRNSDKIDLWVQRLGFLEE